MNAETPRGNDHIHEWGPWAIRDGARQPRWRGCVSCPDVEQETPRGDDREVLAEVIQAVTDKWDEPLDEVHDVPQIVNAVLAEGFTRAPQDDRAAQADAWDAGYYRAVLDTTSDIEPADNPYLGAALAASPVAQGERGQG